MSEDNKVSAERQLGRMAEKVREQLEAIEEQLNVQMRVMEESHNEYELTQSLSYGPMARVMGHISEAIDKLQEYNY